MVPEKKRDLPGGEPTTLTGSGFRNYPAANTDDQGMDYYVRFLKKFPDIHSLAAADEEKC